MPSSVFYPILHKNGEPLERNMELRQDAPGEPIVELNGFQFTSVISNNLEFSDDLGSFDIVVDVPTASFRISLTKLQIGMLPGHCYYRVYWQAVGYDPETLVTGSLSISGKPRY